MEWMDRVGPLPVAQAVEAEPAQVQPFPGRFEVWKQNGPKPMRHLSGLSGGNCFVVES